MNNELYNQVIFIAEQADALVQSDLSTLDRIQAKSISMIYGQSSKLPEIFANIEADSLRLMKEEKMIEIREALTTIHGYALLLIELKYALLNDDQRMYLRNIIRDAQLLCDRLDIAQLESGNSAYS